MRKKKEQESERWKHGEKVQMTRRNMREKETGYKREKETPRMRKIEKGKCFTIMVIRQLWKARRPLISF